jgi:hypothetical protein
MTEKLPDKGVLERVRELQRRRREIMALPPEQALGRILSDPQPAALVHSFPESDFYLLVHDIGPEDALPLLALASDRQWDHVLDLEAWAKDRIEATAATRWLNLLFEADPRRFIRWSLKERLEFIEFYLFHHIEVRVREHDQDPSELGEDFFTLDQVYYFRFLKLPPLPPGSAIGEEERRGFLMKFLQRLAEHDHLVFQNLLLEATHVIPAETEEEQYHWRGVRLEEKGLVPFDEAVGIYQPIKARQLASRAPKASQGGPAQEASLLPVPVYPLQELTQDNRFTRALAQIEPGSVLTQIQWEFANLCNRIIVADHRSVRDREQLREVVSKACGYVSLGLERLGGQPSGGPGPDSAAALRRYPLLQLFRLGFGAALELKWQAERWLGDCWFARSGLRLTFWGEQWMGVLGGILLKKPLFYDNYRSGVLYREFASPEDVALTEAVFRQVQAVDRLLALMTIRLDKPSRYGFLTWKNLLLTLWAARRIGVRKKVLGPIPLPQFDRFFSELFPGRLNPEAAEPRRIPEAMKAAFVIWLAKETGLADYEISECCGKIFTELFAEIEAECGRVAAGDLDPRFVQLFLLST